MARYVVEWNAHLDAHQVEVEADSVMEAIQIAQLRSGPPVEPEPIEGESSYGRSDSYANGPEQRWQRVTFNVLPGGFVDEEVEA